MCVWWWWWWCDIPSYNNHSTFLWAQTVNKSVDSSGDLLFLTFICDCCYYVPTTHRTGNVYFKFCQLKLDNNLCVKPDHSWHNCTHTHTHKHTHTHTYKWYRITSDHSITVYSQHSVAWSLINQNIDWAHKQIVVYVTSQIYQEKIVS